MALKLGKCRLCLKLGDFYSIFTVDNAVQLAEMVMECSSVKIYEGDGLPDKVCSECIQKLSGAYIFKQQCERADRELRQNYVPPPGITTTPPANRQSSDSAFSMHTDLSNNTKPPSNEKVASAKRNRKRSRESVDTSLSSQSHEFKPTSTKRVEQLKMSIRKRPRVQTPKYYEDFDYEDTSFSQLSGGTDSDEPLIKKDYNCQQCGKVFKDDRSLKIHCTLSKHSYDEGNSELAAPTEELTDAKDSDDKLSCEKCGKTFKLKIMYNRHQDSCEGHLKKKEITTPKKELQVSLEPIKIHTNKPLGCQMCSTKFKTVDNLEKHMRVCHSAVLDRSELDKIKTKPSVPCLFCKLQFDDYYLHGAHFGTCSKMKDLEEYTCLVCFKSYSAKKSYFAHLKNVHYDGRVHAAPELLQCRVCKKKLASHDLLVTHLEEHMPTPETNNDTRQSTHDESSEKVIAPNELNCNYCDKAFKYKRALTSHELRHTSGEIPIKTEPPDKDNSVGDATLRAFDQDSGDDVDEDSDNTCDICEKHFSYRRLLLQHKKAKHNMSSGTKRAKVLLKDCLVRCLICDVEMRVGEVNPHNQLHAAQNVKPRNLYTCAQCAEQFRSCTTLANHIKIVHRLKQQPAARPSAAAPDLADFCEVVVTKTEPLDHIQGCNGGGEVSFSADSSASAGRGEAAPAVDAAGFDCPTCGKTMPTLVALRRHVNWHSNVGNYLEKKLDCFVCNENFRFKCHYKMHMREHYKDPNIDPKFLTCSICKRKSKHLRAAQAHLNYHKQTRFKAKDYQCSICKRVFQFRKVYLSHMAVHFKRGDASLNTVVGDREPKGAGAPAGAHDCGVCGKACDSATSLKHHAAWHNSKTLLFGSRHECPVCQLAFTNKRRMQLHVRLHYEDERGPFRCSVCQKGFSDEAYFRRHVKGHNFDHQSHQKRREALRRSKVKCPICARLYPDLAKLIRHLRLVHPDSKMIKSDPDAPAPARFSCKLCAKAFPVEARLKAHEERHLRKPEHFKCKFCGRNSSSLKAHNIHLKSHFNTKHLAEPLRCYECPETFVRGRELHRHLKAAHGISETWIAERTARVLEGPLRKFQCALCLKVLASRGNFERHLDYHNTLRCNYCFESFSAARFLEGHLAFGCAKRALIGDSEVFPKRVKCHLCYKAFHVQVKLDCHLRTQHGVAVQREASGGERQIVCDYCFKVFENSSALASHQIYHRTVGYYGCIYCPKKFNTLTQYRKHKNHHFAQLNAEKPTKCEHCDERFVAFREMIYHMRDAHGDDKEWVVEPREVAEETCQLCSKKFHNLPRHLAYHAANRCRKCGEHFFSEADCDAHLCSIESDAEQAEGAAADLRPQYEECRFCFKPITRKNSRLKHDNLHKTSGSISCRFCRLKFKTIDAFNIHSFSHRSRKYTQKPIKCRLCAQKFVRYGPFMAHMRTEHKSKQKVHYRALVREEQCAVCRDFFPNLHNHYRAHLQNQCQLCGKYFTSSRLFERHECAKADEDPAKVFASDENLAALIDAYVPQDEKDDQKFYGFTDSEDDGGQPAHAPDAPHSQHSQDSQEGSQTSELRSPVISDVLSLHPSRAAAVNGDVVALSDDSVGFNDDEIPIVITIEDD